MAAANAGALKGFKWRLILLAIPLLGVVPVFLGADVVYHAQRGTAFTIAGTLQQPPTPGGTVPIALKLTNPHPFPIIVRTLKVKVTRLTAGDGANTACSPANFAVRQLAGKYGFVLAAISTSTLSDLGVRQSSWPQLSMSRSAANQDACQGVAITLTVIGTARKVK